MIVAYSAIINHLWLSHVLPGPQHFSFKKTPTHIAYHDANLFQCEFLVVHK